jgi:two-component system chemotaxis sensor kinase CheA
MGQDELQQQAFREEAYELLSELETGLLELEQAPTDRDLINRIFRALHTIKGSGSMFGFTDIAAFTHEVETIFELVRNEDLDVSSTLLNLVFAARDHIKEMLDGSSDGRETDPEAAAAILDGLRALEGQPPTAAAPEEEAEAEEEEALPLHEETPDISLAPLDSPILYRIRIKRQTSGAGATENLQSVFEELGKLGQARTIAHTGDIPSLHDFDPDLRYVWWDVLLRSAEPQAVIEDVFFFAESDLDVAVTVVEDARDEGEEVEPKRLGQILVERGDVRPEELEKALSSQKPLGRLLAEAGLAAESVIESALMEQQAVKELKAQKPKPAPAPKPAADEAKAKAADSSSIRVAADKLDYLVDLVGELVIVQAQITQVVGQRGDALLTALAEQLERLSNDLRDNTLGIRMLPIGTTFSKFRRLVRDLSNELGKEIDLVTRGAETELDKTVIERLGDPLVHLLRNSIDHGVEPPADRQAVGKPPKGTILLSAEHSGGEVLIQIIDDGKGMDPEAIRRKAVERGIIAADTELPHKEILGLIFQPGFSTAAKVTSVSGRGVGMDVVKRAIDSLRGSIDLHSELGKGSTITIKLPLTLAIIDGLQVVTSGEYYVVPLSLVEECVELTRQDVENSHGQQIINLRGDIVPYIRLRDWFEIPGECPPIEQIVITGVEGVRVGIVVDHVIGEHQTVIKSLGRVYRDVEGISGATIKGDGTMALILDVPRLVRAVMARHSERRN